MELKSLTTHFFSVPLTRRMMNLTKNRSTLLSLLMVNVISTTIHYSDNAVYLSQYPGPKWFTAIDVVLTVAVMTPIGFLGYWLYTKNFFGAAYLFLIVYSTKLIQQQSFGL